MFKVLRQAVESPRCRQQGFTLLEVLVALAVLAITMGALIKVTDSYAFNAGYLQEKNPGAMGRREQSSGIPVNAGFPTRRQQVR